jgi:DNA repair protein RadA/Sms
MKTLTKFICRECGYESPKWMGRCPSCSTWESLIEERTQELKKGRKAFPRGEVRKIGEVRSLGEKRYASGIGEFDRVLGGGVVEGSLILIGGDPGIGKSTLVLQVTERLAQSGEKVFYVSGEESLEQIKLRSDRLGVSSENLYLFSETNLEGILEEIEGLDPEIVVMDSIQTIYHPEIMSAPGSVGQVRECGGEIMRFAKRKGIAFFLVGHVTKEGAIAGPRILEHLVDTVLYLEGDRRHQFRILRGVKNRFGSTHEIGVFEMREMGLFEVKNPSEVFLSERRNGISGSAVICTLEGSRPLLVEIQALVTPSRYGVPQRVATGTDSRRLAMLLAVLEKRVGLHVGNSDVFINAAGGLRVEEPAADLGVLLAIASSFKNRPLSAEMAVMGEVGLGGEIRRIGQVDRRIREAERLGFSRCLIAQNNLRELNHFSIEVTGVENVENALDFLM